jgi:hypothetical protein
MHGIHDIRIFVFCLLPFLLILLIASLVRFFVLYFFQGVVAELISVLLRIEQDIVPVIQLHLF